jgi:putative spermidine/putrescine transport system substrate-binding protein
MHSRALTIFLLLCLVSPPSLAQEVLRILTWPGYADKDLTSAFEARYDVAVEVTYVGTDDELQQKLSAAGSNYDVIAANTSEIQLLSQRQLLQPLRLNKLTNRSRQLAQFRQLQDIPGLVTDGKVYGIPYTFSEMGLIYNRKLFSTPPDSINSLWDPRFQGQVLAHDSSSHDFSLARLALGKAPFAIPAAELPEAVDKLVALRRNALAFYQLPEESVALFSENRVALLYANFGRQQLKLLQDAGADVDYVIPREGALAWLDCWAISNSTGNRNLAEKWINYSLEPEVSQALTDRQGLANTLSPTDTAPIGGKLIWLQPVEDPRQRAELWQRILEGERPESLVLR